MRSTSNRQGNKGATVVRVAAVALWLAVWQLASLLVAQPLILPGPAGVASSLLGLVTSGAFWGKVGFSAARILGGMLAAYVLALVLATLSHASTAVRALVRVPLAAIKSTPVVCVVVLLLIWLGSANVSVAAVFLMALPGVYFPVLEGLDQIAGGLDEVFSLHGVRGAARVLGCAWPQVLPYVIAASETVVGMSWKAGVAAELIGVPAGSIGERIYQAKLLLDTADLFAWTIAVIALASVCERVFLHLVRTSGAAAVRAAVIMRLSPAGVRAEGARGGWCLRGVRLCHGVTASVSVHVENGGRLCVMAPSGAGKSTLLRTLAGLENALAGEVTGPRALAVESQDARLVEDASALCNVALTAGPGVGVDEIRELLGRLVPGIDEDAAVRDLSGGQRRRVELARALLAPGDSVLLDEPFAGLDDAARDLACDVIAGELRGRSLIVSTHDARDAARLEADTLVLAG